MEENTQKTNLYRVGSAIFIVLIFMTAGEFAIGKIVPTWGWALLVVAFIKASLIVRDYMHIGRLFSGGEEE
jgi:hypothetical protein